MTVNAGLINAQIPMSAKASLPDVAGSINEGYTMRGNMVRQQAEERQINEAQNDQATIQSYLKSGGDFYTPQGVMKAVDDLKGKVTSGTYMKLMDQATKVKKLDIDYRKSVQDMNEADLMNRSKQIDQTLTYLTGPLKVYEELRTTKGEQEAVAQFEAAKKAAIVEASKQVGANGQPLYDPQVLERFAKSSPDELKGFMAGTTYQKAIIQERVQQSQVARNEALQAYDLARAKAVQEGRLNQGALSEIAKIDRDVKANLITPEEGQRMIQGIVAKKAAPSEVSGLTPEAIDRTATDYYMFGNLPARLTPVERTKILNRAAEIAAESGDTAEEQSIRQAQNKASKVALNDIKKRYSLTAVFERDADKRLGLVQELAKKADLSGVPALNRWIRAGRQQIAGDEDVNNLNSAMISAQAELAKVLSGALGNAGVSDAARAEAAQIINSNMSPEQINSLIPNIRKELKFKMDAFQEQMKELEDGMKMPRGKTPITPRTEDVRPGSGGMKPQAELDSDRPKILRSEYQKAQERLAAAKDPESRQRAEDDIKALVKEGKSAGINLGEAAAAPAAAPAATAAPASLPPTNSKGWKLMTDAKGRRAYVSPDMKSFEEVK